MSKIVIKCPQCNVEVNTDVSASAYECPICNQNIDVQAQIAKMRISKEGLVSIVKYEGGNNTFVWKHPIEDFNLGSQLIVHESQEALFFRDGQALDLFGAGRYTLETQNLPLLEKIYRLPTGGETPFHAEVYFINKTVQMGIKWGTDSKERMFDPISGLHIDIGASGEFNLRVADSRKLVLKLVGTAGGLERGELLSMGKSDGNSNGMQGYFRALIMTQVKTHLAQSIKAQSINILEIDAKLTELSQALKDQVNAGLEEYGLTMPEFFVVRVVTPDDDSNFKRMKQQYADQYLKIREEQIRKTEAEAAAERKLVEAETEARMKIVGAKGEAETYRLQAEVEAKEMQMKGYTYQQETSRQVGMEAMKNGIAGEGGGGSGGVLGDVAGLGIALGAMGGVVGMTKDALNPMIDGSLQNTMGGVVTNNASEGTARGWSCPACGKTENISNFCGECGAKRPETSSGWACNCGQNGITSKFCPECGTKRPE
ncbi:MAG: SPFH domain-containing protein [Suipraeoptans sp.]